MKDYRSGTLVEQSGGGRSFQPSLLDRPWELDDLTLIRLLGEASWHLGRLDHCSQRVPRLGRFLDLFLAKEAVASCRVAGLSTTIEDALSSKENIEREQRTHWEAAHNGVDALRMGTRLSVDWSDPSRSVRQLHAVLVDGVQAALPLSPYRTHQRSVESGVTRLTAYVPPVPSSIQAYVEDWEQFLDTGTLPDLLRIAMAHYQLVTIYPFAQANGRLGRLLLPLLLLHHGLLTYPVLYLSDYFERHRAAYHWHLSKVRTHSDWAGWCTFFLTGIIETAQHSLQAFERLSELRMAVSASISKRNKSVKTLHTLMDQFYQSPLLNASELRERTGLSKPTVSKGLTLLLEMGWLCEITGKKRYKIYRFQACLDLFKGVDPGPEAAE